MNILVVSRSTTEHFQSGGMETQLKNLVEGLANNGHKVTVLTTSLGSAIEDVKKTENGVHYIYVGDTTPGLIPLTLWEIPHKKIGWLKRGVDQEGSRNFFEVSQKYFDELNALNDFDLIISQSTFAQGIKTSIPIISIIHGTIKAEIKNRFKTNKTFMNWGRFLGVDLPVKIWELYTSNRQFFKRCNQIIAVSSVLKKQFAEDHPMFSDKVKVIHNGVDSDFFNPRSAGGRSGSKKYSIFTILYIGRLDREKGVDLIIEAVAKLRHRKLEVNARLIGGGVDVHVKELKELTAKLCGNDYIEFHGQVSNEKLPSLYQKSHVFVLASRRQEGHPMTISEALCSGLPVICTKSGGLAELIADGKDGLFIKQNDVNDLVAKLEYLYKNKKVIQEMSQKARESGVKKYSRKAMVKNYEKIFEKLA